jgi:hypothetical protein
MHKKLRNKRQKYKQKDMNQQKKIIRVTNKKWNNKTPKKKRKKKQSKQNKLTLLD